MKLCCKCSSHVLTYPPLHLSRSHLSASTPLTFSPIRLYTSHVLTYPPLHLSRSHLSASTLLTFSPIRLYTSHVLTYPPLHFSRSHLSASTLLTFSPILLYTSHVLTYPPLHFSRSHLSASTLVMFSPIRFYTSRSHLSASTLRSVPAWIMTCQCFRSSAISVWFLVISSFTRSRHLSFGLPQFRIPSTVICNIFIVASYLSRLCTCPYHLNLFSLRNSAIGYMCASFQMSTFLT